MSRRASSTLRAPRRPHFYWQGTLIVLPALVLAAAGFSALRQDRAYAEHEAREQARRVAGELVQTIMPRLLQDEGRARPALSTAPTVPARPEDDLLLAGVRGSRGHLVFAVSEQGELVYPPPAGPLPLPAPLEQELLDAAQAGAWNALQESWNAATTGKGEELQRLLDAFLALSPPPRFAGVAMHRTAQGRLRAGDRAGAITLLRSCSNLPEVTGETGLALRDVAELELLPLVGEAERQKITAELGNRLVAKPTPMSPLMLAVAARSEETAKAWIEMLAAHERARDFFAACEAAARSELPVSWEGTEYWLLVEKVEGGRWIIGLLVTEASEMMGKILARQILPNHFDVALSFQGRVVHPAQKEDAEVLARSTLQVPMATGEAPLVVEVMLGDPSGFYGRQRARTIRFGALIGVAAVAVLVGFLSAWRAFRRQQQLSEMKTNFVASVSHELRAPIASVRLMAEELEASPGTAEKAGQYHRFISQECRRLSAVIENVLDFSRAEQGREQFHFETTRLDQLIEETVRVMRLYAAEKEVKLETVVSGEGEVAEADPRSLGRLLVNLLDNAIKHSPLRGIVKVGLEFTAARFRLWVEDDGPGIPEEEHGRIFERFYRIGSELQRETPGVGLGLAIVRQVTTAHGGRILVRSAPGSGSRFTIDLPLRQACAGENSPAPTP